MPRMDGPALLASLGRSARGELRADHASRELYAHDASIYRRLPVATLRARDADDLDAAVAACRETGTPLTVRGAGTSLGGQAVGTGLVVDTTALDGIAIDPGRRSHQRSRPLPREVSSRTRPARSSWRRW